MGVEPFLIASTVRVVIGQRLVRRLCLECRESFAPDTTVMKQVVKSFRIDDNGGMKRLHELELSAVQGSIGTSGDSHSADAGKPSTTGTNITRLWRAHEEWLRELQPYRL